MDTIMYQFVQMMKRFENRDWKACVGEADILMWNMYQWGYYTEYGHIYNAANQIKKIAKDKQEYNLVLDFGTTFHHTIRIGWVTETQFDDLDRFCKDYNDIWGDPKVDVHIKDFRK